MSEPTIEVTCPVCHEQVVPVQLITTTLCGHIFHEECLTPWTLAGHTTCPVCRADLATGAPAVVAPVAVAAPAAPAGHQNAFVVPSGHTDASAAVVSFADVTISGGVGGGYVDVQNGTGNTAVEGTYYDLLLQDGTVAVSNIYVYGDHGDGMYVFAFPAGGLNI